MKVCFWVTSFQSDTQALAYHLAEQPGLDVLVAMPEPAAYALEAVHRVLPFHGRFLDRQARAAREQLKAFSPDLVVVDNHLPPWEVAPRMLVSWHGFGWRVDDLTQMRKELRRHVGDVTRPNPRFRWQAFGEWDRRYRIDRSMLHADNVVALGSPYSDWLRPESAVRQSFSRTAVQSSYRIDLARPVVLLALTWHHGGSLHHWGDEAELLSRFFAHVAGRSASVLVRMHDRHRYEAAYLAMLESLVQRHPNVQLKFKSSSPDSLVDLLVSDIMVSNYSSIANAFYYGRRPSVHIDPAGAPGAPQVYRRWKDGRLEQRLVSEPAAVWKLPPEQNGGLRARSFKELCDATDRALSEPDCCAESSKSFCDRYITAVDGEASQRVAGLIQRWAGTA